MPVVKCVSVVVIAAALVASDLQFVPAMDCARAHDVQRCHVAGPKNWTPDEERVLRTSWQRLEEHALVRGLLVAVRENGYHGFSRYRSDTQLQPTGGIVTKFGPGFVWYTPKVIGFTDRFFDLAGVIDPIAGHRVTDIVLLHELAHAFDHRRLSTGEDFAAISGWQRRNGRWEYANRVSISAYNGVYAETVTLYARGKYAEAWARDRTFATRLPFPVPTIQSLATPEESFADILAHLLIDDRAPGYLQPELVEWFRTNIFPRLAQAAGGAPGALARE